MSLRLAEGFRFSDERLAILVTPRVHELAEMITTGDTPIRYDDSIEHPQPDEEQTFTELPDDAEEPLNKLPIAERIDQFCVKFRVRVTKDLFSRWHIVPRIIRKQWLPVADCIVGLSQRCPAFVA